MKFTILSIKFLFKMNKKGEAEEAFRNCFATELMTCQNFKELCHQNKSLLNF